MVLVVELAVVVAVVFVLLMVGVVVLLAAPTVDPEQEIWEFDDM